MPELAPRKSGAEHLAEAEAVDVAAEPLGPEPLADLDRADVARLGDDVDERQQAVMVGVADLARGRT